MATGPRLPGNRKHPPRKTHPQDDFLRRGLTKEPGLRLGCIWANGPAQVRMGRMLTQQGLLYDRGPACPTGHVFELTDEGRARASES
jgi:hypothetical protein